LFVRTRKIIPALSNESGLELSGLLLLKDAPYYLSQDDAKMVAQ